MDTAIAIGIALGILWQGYELGKRQYRMRKDMRDLIKANEDLNIEFSAMEGSGITQVKKNYPDLELKDDHRTGLENA